MKLTSSPSLLEALKGKMQVDFCYGKLQTAESKEGIHQPI